MGYIIVACFEETGFNYYLSLGDSLVSTSSDRDVISQYKGTIIPDVQIQIRNTVGEGNPSETSTTYFVYPWPSLPCKGEFGVVYRAHLLRKGTMIATQVVAVKTLKGEVFKCNAFFMR